MFQNLGPLRRIEVVVAETACEIEGPEGKFTAAGVPATVHVVPLRPLDTIAQPAKDAAAVAVDRSLQFEVYAQYATQSGLETALGHFIGRQLVYSPAGRGPFQVLRERRRRSSSPSTEPVLYFRLRSL